MKPVILILRGPGTNCDLETEHACARAGGAPERVHVRQLISEPARLRGAGLLVFPGGFSYGDDLGAGRVLAGEVRARLLPEIDALIERGGLVLGICNGFQVLVRLGLVPGGPHAPQGAALTNNDSGRFEDRWIHLAVASRRSPFLQAGPDLFALPVAHGEGKYVPGPGWPLERLRAGDQIALRYWAARGGPAAYPENPNGSTDGIAGVTDPTGRVLGLMPHPERHFEGWQHPAWTRAGAKAEGDGAHFFRNAVEHLKAST